VREYFIFRISSQPSRRHFLRGSIRKNELLMSVDNPEWSRMLGLSPMPPWAEVWHLWKVVIPRRSITGRLLMGQVWRRHDGRRWIYKPFTEYNS